MGVDFGKLSGKKNAFNLQLQRERERIFIFKEINFEIEEAGSIGKTPRKWPGRRKRHKRKRRKQEEEEGKIGKVQAK